VDPTGHWYGPDEYDPAGIETLLEAYAFAEMSGDESVLRWPGGTPYDKPPRAIDHVVGLAADFTPGVGDVKGLIEVFTGEDLVTGERLGYWRWLGLLGVSELRHLDEASDALRVGREALEELPEQLHHVATIRSQKWTGRMAEIAQRYGLDLKGDWNTVRIPHRGRHADAYHEWVLERMRSIDRRAQGNQEVFLELYEREVREVVREHPEMLRRWYWEEWRP